METTDRQSQKVAADREGETMIKQIYISRVYHLRNDRIMSFDADRNQLPDYCGDFDAIIDKVLADAPGHAVFYVQGYSMKVSREAFKNKTIWKTINGGKRV
jgi:hypothetical protein